ncbi:helix-turn-helix domain-containing protein [Clostridium sp. Marseille-P2415]|uniref:helix-turn-helix domain-containing protein n=1 Tax=Clostridium sp. Marseille-P2415 TaxID=1805471 RepID=UPI0013565F1D|nr:helix-turn-helix domain-containing protein [Clostridium sp. Marseille-P2415]
MNTNYLIQHISYHLHTFVRSYSLNKQLLSSFCARMNFDDMPLALPGTREFILDIPPAKLPLLTSVNGEIVYAAVAAPDRLFLIGPVCFNTPVQINHRISGAAVDSSWKQNIFCCDFDDFARDVLLIHNLFQDNALDMDDLISLNCVDPMTSEYVHKNFSELVFENRESGKKHNPFDQEIREFTSIENGDIRQLEQSWAEDYTGKLGTLAKDKMRSFKNICIVVITLASRAAIRGGVSPEISFSLSDIYIMKIEEASDIATLTHLKNSAEYEYAMMVQEIKERRKGKQEREKNPRIDLCKDYIFAHLHGKIQVAEIAEKLDMNPKYLSDLFKQWEGISITDYILNEKIKLAKNLLVYSRYHYIEIAAYLGFSSQSHLGKQFKKVTGMTLKQYRTRYGVKEFI